MMFRRIRALWNLLATIDEIECNIRYLKREVKELRQDCAMQSDVNLYRGGGLSFMCDMRTKIPLRSVVNLILERLNLDIEPEHQCGPRLFEKEKEQ